MGVHVLPRLRLHELIHSSTCKVSSWIRAIKKKSASPNYHEIKSVSKWLHWWNVDPSGPHSVGECFVIVSPANVKTYKYQFIFWFATFLVLLFGLISSILIEEISTTDLHISLISIEEIHLITIFLNLRPLTLGIMRSSWGSLGCSHENQNHSIK